MRPANLIFGASILACAVSGSAVANVMPGTVIGVFDGVNPSGNVLNDPSSGKITFYNNTGTAVSSINNSTNPATAGTPPLQSTGSVLSWGDNSGGSGQPSTIEFFGAVLPANVNQSFRVGSLIYTNGTSSISSSIFGATISFYAGSVSTANFLGTDTISITGTSNLGASTSQDADYINVCGPLSTICGTSVAAVEVSQGGKGVTVDLFGKVVGDPQLFINAVQLAAGQSSTTNGFLGNDPPIGLLPEPGTVALLASGLIALAFTRRNSLSR